MHISHLSFARRLAALACATYALAVLAPAGALAAAPSVSGARATAFWGSGATVAGTVDPNGQAGSYKFQYGTWGLYGSNTAQVSFSASNAPLNAHALLSNLSPASLYFVRLVANNRSGTTLGANFEFSTAPGPQPRVSVANATDVQSHSATLHATVTPGIYAGSYKFEYSRTRARFELSTPTVHFSPGAVALSATATVQSLRAGTTYYFRLVAHSGRYTTDGTGASFTSQSLFAAPGTAKSRPTTRTWTVYTEETLAGGQSYDFPLPVWFDYSQRGRQRQTIRRMSNLSFPTAFKLPSDASAVALGWSFPGSERCARPNVSRSGRNYTLDITVLC